MSEISQYTESLHEECGVFGMYDEDQRDPMVSAYTVRCTPCSTVARRVAALR